jgi:predicted RNase H-like nuclease (RuvC/YqgF family)
MPSDLLIELQSALESSRETFGDGNLVMPVELFERVVARIQKEDSMTTELPDDIETLRNRTSWATRPLMELVQSSLEVRDGRIKHLRAELTAAQAEVERLKAELVESKRGENTQCELSYLTADERDHYKAERDRLRELIAANCPQAAVGAGLAEWVTTSILHGKDGVQEVVHFEWKGGDDGE